MIAVLIIIILILCVVIVYLCIDFSKEKKIFKKRISDLEDVIIQIKQEQNIQFNQLELADNFNFNYKKNKGILNKTIFDLNNEMFQILSKNNLLKK